MKTVRDGFEQHVLVRAGRVASSIIPRNLGAKLERHLMLTLSYVNHCGR